MPLTNSVSLLLPPSTKVFVEAMSNSAAVQTVTLTPPAGTPAMFKGTGEGNIRLPVVSQGFLSPTPVNGQPSFTTPAAGGAYKVTITTSLPNLPVVTGGKSAVQTPNGGDFGLSWAVSEDSVDADFNDATVLFTYYSANPPI